MILYYSALVLFILCHMINIRNLLPCFGNQNMKYLLRSYEELNPNRTTEGIVEYYNANRDLRILLDILATNYGLGHAMAAMALFDTVI